MRRALLPSPRRRFLAGAGGIGNALAALVAVTILCLAPGPVRAESPGDFVRDMLEQVARVLETHSGGRPEQDRVSKVEAIKGIISTHFDRAEMAKNALGSHWDRITEEEKRAFSDVFDDLFLDSYTRLVLNFLKREELELLEEGERNGLVTVQTRIRRANDEIPVEYILKRDEDRFRTVDVDIDGVRIVENYRRIFDAVIQRASFSALLEKMRVQQQALKQKGV